MSKRTDTSKEEDQVKPEAFYWPFPRFNFGKNSSQVFSGPTAVEDFKRSKEGNNSSAGGNISGRSNVGIKSSDVLPGSGKRRGRPPKNAGILDQHRDLPIVSPSEATTVWMETPGESKTLASQNGEQPVKRGRGRPRKIKPLD
jgi:hypothetical protein